MNDNGVQQESEFVFRRLTETLKIPGFTQEVSGLWWLLVLGVVLVVAFGLVVWMYARDSRSVRWYWALPLGLLRLTVYALLAIAFLMPAKQNYDRVEKHSRVLVVIDVSDSMAQLSDEAVRSSSKPVTRLGKIVDFLSDEKIGFIQKLIEKNPVLVYRVGNRLDEEVQTFEKGADGSAVPIFRAPSAEGEVRKMAGHPWANTDWAAFASYDFKPWLLRGLNDEGATKVKAHAQWEGDTIGNAEWAQRWYDKKDEAYPSDLSPDDKTTLLANRDKLLARLDVARSISSATNIPDSLLALVNRESGNMVQGMIVFSDGQSNLGNDAVLQDLRIRSTREQIPIFTIGIGSERKSINVRITDVQAPELTPPDEPWKVIVEQDGEGLTGQKAKIELEVQLPKVETLVRLPVEAGYLPGEPPHAQAEILIDPEKVPESFKNKDNPKALMEGEWRVRAVTPRVDGETFNEKEHVSEWVTVKVQQKPQRVLLMCSAPNRDVQFLITQLLRDKADLSLFIQNDGGTNGKVNLLEDADRQLQRFPDKLRIDEIPNEQASDKWYNLARYDVILAFDVDWDQFTKEQIDLVRTWVDLQAGGIAFIAGNIYTKHLARPNEDKFRGLTDILPVFPGDPDLAAAKRSATQPWRLEFENLGGDLEFMRLDDTVASDKLEVGWERFFTGRDDKDEKARMLRGFYNYFPVREMKPVATPIARYPDPNAIKLPDGKSPPWLAVMQYGQGKSAWIGSPELWRLRQYKEEYHQRFWTKFIRYLGSGSRRKQTQRGRILMGAQVPIGGYVRVTAQVLDPSLKPIPQNQEPKITLRPVEFDKYPAEIEKMNNEAQISAAKAKYHARFTHEYRMNPKKGAEDWQGYFQRSQLVTAEKFPPGAWRAEVEIPSSTDTLKYKFSIRQSNPELDVSRPDFKALYQMASVVTDVLPRITDNSVATRLQNAAPVGTDGKRLTFKFADEESIKLIPECMKSEPRTIRNLGKVEDYWDKGFELPTWMTQWLTGKTDRPMKIGALLFLVVGLLSLEWLIRKLLKLA
jgi:hypothetical protein